MLLLPSAARKARYSARRSTGVTTKGETLKYLAGAAALASVFVLAGVAAANTTGDVLTLYPVGGGQDTYAAWKAQEGRPDSQGTANQALYFQRRSSAPAAAHVLGLEGAPVTALVSLSYEHRVPGLCAKSDPRWTLFVRGKSGKEYLVNLGCALTPGQPTDDPHWVRRFFSAAVIRAEVLRQSKGTDALAGTIDGLALVVDRTAGSVDVDNVSVRSKTASKTWTYAGDNGNAVPSSSPTFTAEQSALMAAPIPDDSQFDEDVLMPSLTADEQAAIAVEDWG
jgi:hypothetical protein